MLKRYSIHEIAKNEEFPFHIETACLQSDFIVHRHDFSELVVILKGKSQHIIDGKEYTIKAGDVYVVNGDTSHGFSAVDNLCLCNIMFDGEKMFAGHADLKKMPGFQALFVLEPFYRKEHQFKSKLQLTREKLKRAEEFIYMMLEEYTAKKDGHKSILQAYFTAFTVFLSREYTGGESDASGQLLRLAECIAYMEAHYTNPVSLGELSSRAFISTRHFNRVFKQNYRTTPLEYIIHLRLMHACKLLKNRGMSITQVALESGFSDSNYFARRFKGKFGMSPGEYRSKFV